MSDSHLRAPHECPHDCFQMYIQLHVLLVVKLTAFPPEWLKLRNSSQTIRIVSAAIAYDSEVHKFNSEQFSFEACKSDLCLVLGK